MGGADIAVSSLDADGLLVDRLVILPAVEGAVAAVVGND